MKTAISVPDDIFREVDRLSKETHRSRSEIFSEAVREYLRRLQNKKMLDRLNEAYAEPESKEAVSWRKAAKRRYAEATKGERW